MILLKLKIKIKKNNSPDEIGMLNAYDRPADFTDKRKILPIIDYINEK